jgi:tRNA G46 methylase TrmB
MGMTSREVASSQTAPHPRLGEVVRRHLQQPFRRQPSDAGRRAFEQVLTHLAQAPFVLDAGCGTGAGTLALARAWSDTLVLGGDKSAARLAVGQRLLACGEAPANAVLLRCELVDFWQLAATAQLRCARQYLLYPNPWPKPEHLMRRWHAHPVLPSLLALGGTIELRTNWPIYADEFAAALRQAGWRVRCDALTPAPALTPFEAKYLASGHRLRRCVADSHETPARPASS